MNTKLGASPELARVCLPLLDEAHTQSIKNARRHKLYTKLQLWRMFSGNSLKMQWQIDKLNFNYNAHL